MRGPESIIAEAMTHNPVAVYVGFSGGGDSMAVTHWMMNNIPGCEVFHANTGIGVEATRQFVRDTCRDMGWPLHEIRAKEDCGQDYDEFVRRWGFPGPAGHGLMYARLKDRCIEKLVRDVPGRKRGQRVLIATGIRHDESVRRMRYGSREVNTRGSQVWCNPLYWWTAAERDAYRAAHNLPRNPTSEMLGMSGECLCGAFAHPGELDMVRIVCPATAARIDRLHDECCAKGMTWGWEGRAPRSKKTAKPDIDRRPLCVGCEKIHSTAEEIMKPAHWGPYPTILGTIERIPDGLRGNAQISQLRQDRVAIFWEDGKKEQMGFKRYAREMGKKFGPP